jgi:hypothetical protein
VCRSIKLLRTAEDVAEYQGVREASLQFVRKISGIRKPSQVQVAAFEAAIDEIVAASSDLLTTLGPRARSAA